MSVVMVLLMSCSSEKFVAPYNQDPTISISSHADGDSIHEGTTTTFQAVAGDLNHNLSELSVRWLNSEGEICPNESPDSTGISLCVHIPQQGDSWIRVQVIDPDGALAEDQVELNITYNTPPLISILSPQTNDSLTEGDLVSFQAILSDAEDPPSLLQYQWTSNHDGILPMTTSPQETGLIDGFSTLSVGTHVITLLVTDSEGLGTSEVVAIVVEAANQSPECEILEPENQSIITTGEDVNFLGTATDIDSDNSQLTVTWTSSIDGVLNMDAPDVTGTLQFVQPLSSGNHNITLFVEDEMGESCTSSTMLNANSAPDVSIQSPVAGDSYILGETISFLATVGDAEDIVDSLSLTWTSSLDGVFSTQNADAGGQVSFSYDALSQGTHTLTLQAEDALGAVGIDSLDVQIAEGFCDPNPVGTVNISSSAYCDSNPPSGWTQCAGWINTSGDDVTNSILDGCLNNNNRLRIRIWNQATNTLEEDVYSIDTNVSFWETWNYLGGSIIKATSTYWSGTTDYFTTTDGGSACYFNTDCGTDAPCGTMTLGTGNGSSLILAPGWGNEFEVRVNCDGVALNDRIVAVYY